MSTKTAPRRELAVPTEPMGIVISRGTTYDPPPIFSAYEYAPAPDEEPAVALLERR